MKVALIGNMNNINFCLMRYFRDLGVDAHLLLYSNDGKDSLSHFNPINDTWNLVKWDPYIHELPFSNNYRTLIPTPISFNNLVSSSTINKILSRYDKLIGTGLSPAIVNRIGRELDIFFPYSIGVEFISAPEFIGVLNKAGKVKTLLYEWIQKKQIEGVKRARLCLNAEMGYTQKILNEIEVNSKAIPLPMVYNDGDRTNVELPASMKSVTNNYANYDLKIISHARQQWIQKPGYTHQEWKNETKNSDWLIKAFANVLKNFSTEKSVLFLLEYGPDVEASKKLIKEIGIEKYVKWLPKMSRKELIEMIKFSDVGVGEFMIGEGTLWGGTAWEVLSVGKPLLQTLNFTESSYFQKFGHPAPPLFDVKNQQDIEDHLKDYFENEKEFKERGNKGRKWFDNYNGISIAKKWLDLMTETSSE